MPSFGEDATATAALGMVDKGAEDVVSDATLGSWHKVDKLLPMAAKGTVVS